MVFKLNHRDVLNKTTHVTIKGAKGFIMLTTTKSYEQ